MQNIIISGWLFWFLVIFLSIIILFQIFSLLKKIFRFDIENINNIAGFRYDHKQDIYYSVINAWQAKYGYSKMYDRLAPLFSMVFDSEPIRFKYNGKRYLIEFWKGQYGITTGAEIGIYSKKHFWNIFKYKPDFNDLLDMKFDLVRNGKYLFTRNAKHWWLTGFRLGEFVEPEELVMSILIHDENSGRLNAFVKELNRIGYNDNNLNVRGNTVNILFDKPYTKQPKMKKGFIGRASQMRNKLLALSYKNTVGKITITPSVLNFIKKTDLKLYKKAMKICEFSSMCDADVKG